MRGPWTCRASKKGGSEKRGKGGKNLGPGLTVEGNTPGGGTTSSKPPNSDQRFSEDFLVRLAANYKFLDCDITLLRGVACGVHAAFWEIWEILGTTKKLLSLKKRRHTTQVSLKESKQGKSRSRSGEATEEAPVIGGATSRIINITPRIIAGIIVGIINMKWCGKLSVAPQGYHSRVVQIP